MKTREKKRWWICSFLSGPLL